ncbi:MAG: branched-chain amino acid ABC-type transport system, permease component [Acidimicrobiales bacterium]|nr:branched-chain amino acid ABC-type transport system, permease component [Acidimicrobiales bacterium]
MEKFLVFTIVGLSLAAIYAVISSGLVLTYTTTGIFNFAHGAAGMLAAFAYWQLRFDWDWPTPVALFVVLAVLAPVFGLLLERVIMRGLVGTSEATKLVVSISLLAGMIGLANIIWEPGVSRPMETFFRGETIDLGVTTITYHQAITIAVAIFVAVGLRFLLYRTRIGVAMRANVDDRSLALLNGARPDRVALFSWAIGTSLAALGGILIAPSVNLDSGSLSLIIVNAYAAAVFGRLRSLPLTFLGAVVVGLAEGYLFGYLPGDNQYLAGLRPAAAVIILFLVVLVLPNPRLRSSGRLREFFPAPSFEGMLLFAGLVLFGAVVMATTLSDVDQINYGQLFPIGIVALSLVPLLGMAGQISLAQLSFAGIGAVVMAHHGAGGDPVGLLLAVVIAAVAGALVALPLLRMSGIYLALGTAAFAVALDRWIFNLPDFDIGPVHISFFGLGSVPVDPLEVFGYSFDTPTRQLMLSAVCFILVAMLVVTVRRRAFGRRLLAIRDSEAACATFGMDLISTRLSVFTLSSAIAGFGGALFGTQLGSITPQRFDFVTGMPIFMLTVVGGAGLVGGALFAGASLYGVIPILASFGEFLKKLGTVLPGLIGVGLGRNPSGATQQMGEGVAPVRKDRPVLYAMLGAMVLWWGLRVLELYGNWPFALLMVGTFLVAYGVALYRSQAALRALAETEQEERPPELEWIGVTVPWQQQHVNAIDRELALEEVDLHAKA